MHPKKPYARTERFGQDLMRILHREMRRWPHIMEGVSYLLTDMRVSADLRNARVSISVYKGDTDKFIAFLNQHTHAIQQLIWPFITIRHCPKLMFVKENPLSVFLPLPEDALEEQAHKDPDNIFPSCDALMEENMPKPPKHNMHRKKHHTNKENIHNS